MITGVSNITLPEWRTESANAQRFVSMHGRRVLWVDPWKKWLIWDSFRWRIDETREIESLAADVAARVWEEVVEEVQRCESSQMKTFLTFAKETSSRRGVSNFLDLAKHQVAVLPDQLDRDDYLLNVANGTLNLRNLGLESPDPDDYLTKQSPVEFDADATCPQWEAFLHRVLDGRAELIEYMQRLVGLCLTGATTEHILPFLHGAGANGKSVFIGTVLALLGSDYAIKAAPDLLLKKGRSHPTELADLHGRRFVACIETDDGRRMAEGLVKELSGGDKVRARRMREDFWEFRPTHKVWLATNHKPIVRGTDHGIWRRVKLIPFAVTIPEAEQDKALPEKLQGELSGILNWALVGCRQWQQDGINEPDEVRTATATYRNSMDIVGQFIDDCCILGEYSAKASDFRQAFETWCKSQGEEPVSGRQLGDYLAERGITKRRSNGIWYSGIALVEQ